jgi:hypothetical protein
MKALILAVILSGCAAYSGVVPMGKDTYFVSRQAASGFSGAAALKGEVLQDASTHCLTQNKALEVISLTEAHPPYIFGNYPKAEVQFRCVKS